MFRRQLLRGMGAAIGIAGLSRLAVAQDYPSRPITIVVPTPAGGGIDTTARIVGKRLGEVLGQPVIVENKTGAGGAIGTTFVARAVPDGYTLLLGNPGPNVIGPNLSASPPYGIRDFAPITVLTKLPVLICVGADSRIKSFQDLPRLSSNKPLTFGSAGNGSLSHLVGVLMGSAAALSLQHIPYRGAAPLAAAIISEEVDMGFLSSLDARPLLQARKIRAIANTSPTRSPLFQEVPTLGELGVKNADVDIWYGLLAPARTPSAVVSRLNGAVTGILREEAIKSRLEELASTPAPGTPEDFRKLMDREHIRYSKLVRDFNVKAD